jgi:hypothetical protein
MNEPNAECHRLIQLYQSLEANYQEAQALPAPEIAQRLKELEAKFEEAKLKATASPQHISVSGLSVRSEMSPNQSMKPTAPPGNEFIVFATAPCRGLSLSR